MSEKQKLIKEMIAMQREFIDYERKNGLDPADYFLGREDHALYQYKEKYAELASKVLAMAHEQKGSRR